MNRGYPGKSPIARIKLKVPKQYNANAQRATNIYLKELQRISRERHLNGSSINNELNCSRCSSRISNFTRRILGRGKKQLKKKKQTKKQVRKQRKKK